jgi:hypothetical protein
MRMLPKPYKHIMADTRSQRLYNNILQIVAPLDLEEGSVDMHINMANNMMQILS